MKNTLSLLLLAFVVALPACKDSGTSPATKPSPLSVNPPVSTPESSFPWTPQPEGEAFLITDVDLRDPHTYVKNILCLDFTDASIGDYSVNDAIQKALQGDSNSDGRLDDSLLLLFKPDGSLDMLFEPYCTAPLDTASCTKAYARVYPTTFSISQTGTCLSSLPGTTRPYSPAISFPKSPCFSSGTLSAVVNFCGNAITLQDVSVAGTLVGNPPVSILNGMLRGFLTEATADAILLPASMPVVGGLPTSALLPGGKGNCASHSDVDILDGVRGWWFYLNFTASKVPYQTP